MKKVKSNLYELKSRVHFSWQQLRVLHKAINSFDSAQTDDKERARISGNLIDQLVRAEDALRETRKVITQIKKDVRKPLYRALKNSR